MRLHSVGEAPQHWPRFPALTWERVGQACPSPPRTSGTPPVLPGWVLRCFLGATCLPGGFLRVLHGPPFNLVAERGHNSELPEHPAPWGKHVGNQDPSPRGR